MNLINLKKFGLSEVPDIRDPYWENMTRNDMIFDVERDISRPIELTEHNVEVPIIQIVVDEVRQDIVALMEDGEPID